MLIENSTSVSWKSWNSESIENLILKKTSEGRVAESIIISKGSTPFIAKYKIICDKAWRTRKFTIEASSFGDKKTLDLEANRYGKWSDSSGTITRLSGAIDVDVTATPFTNTLSIRRLRLKKNQCKEIIVAYVTVPELGVSTRRQRYTCLVTNRRYRFEQFEEKFVSEIDVDEKGLVLMYPGLFKRM